MVVSQCIARLQLFICQFRKHFLDALFFFLHAQHGTTFLHSEVEDFLADVVAMVVLDDKSGGGLAFYCFDTFDL